MSLLVDLVKRFEGYAKALPDGGCTTYLCAAGVLTIGYGTTGKDIVPGMRWTREQAESRLAADLAKFRRGVIELSPVLAEESEARQTAIISFAYNCGLGAYRDSTLRKCVNREDWEGAQRQIMRWNKAGGRVLRGLTLRREAERDLLE